MRALLLAPDHGHVDVASTVPAGPNGPAARIGYDMAACGQLGAAAGERADPVPVVVDIAGELFRAYPVNRVSWTLRQVVELYDGSRLAVYAKEGT